MQNIMAYDQAHYFDIGTIAVPDIELGGVITKLDEKSNPVEKERQYITDKSKTVDVTSFLNEFPLESDLVKGEAVCDYFFDLFRSRKTGSNLKVPHYIVDLYDEVTPGVYNARKIIQTLIITDMTAPAGDQITIAGSLKGGDFVYGTFNIETKTFTETPTSL